MLSKSDLNVPLEELAKKVKQFRHDANMTIAQLEQACGLSYSTLTQFERGKLNIAYNNLIKILSALDTSLITVLHSTSHNVVPIRFITRDQDSVAYIPNNFVHNLHISNNQHILFRMEEPAMEPKLLVGDLLLLDANDTYTGPNLYCIKHLDSYIIRYINQSDDNEFSILTYNHMHPVLTVPGDKLDILGSVLRMIMFK